MLETVKRYIKKDIPNESFEKFFINYILAVQDKNIELEMEYLVSHNVLDIMKLDRLISDYMDRLVMR